MASTLTKSQSNRAFGIYWMRNVVEIYILNVEQKNLKQLCDSII